MKMHGEVTEDEDEETEVELVESNGTVRRGEGKEKRRNVLLDNPGRGIEGHGLGDYSNS